ncbi:MAG TPA: riboflavin synthase [Thermoanaerobaculia bacterium]|nr:riboflavin synthase [Thermoanaerobaculia bacterium]
MFTGIIHHTGSFETIGREGGGARIVIAADLEDLQRGESVAVNGVCLTVLPLERGQFAADLSSETLARTTLGEMERGARLNLERSLALGDRLGGHLVQGHVDTVGKLTSTTAEGEFAVYRWSFPPAFADLVVDKGSIAVDGISLTIVEPDQSSFGAALIPETLARTNLGDARAGDSCNLEFDVMAKYARSLFLRYLGTRPDPA